MQRINHNPTGAGGGGCNEVTLAPREDTALRPEFGGTRPGMPCEHARSPVTCVQSSWDLGQCVATTFLSYVCWIVFRSVVPLNCKSINLDIMIVILIVHLLGVPSFPFPQFVTPVTSLLLKSKMLKVNLSQKILL